MALRRNIARALLGGTLGAACAPPPAPPPGVPVSAAADPCIIGSGGRDTIVVLLEDSVRAAHAPVPFNDAERLVFRQRYEALLRFDCRRVLRPGLAARWTGDSTGTTWTFELDGRQFSGGDTVTTDLVVESWMWQGLGGRPGVGRPTRRDARTLIIELPLPAPDGPALLADPGSAVGGPAAEDGWPESTRPVPLVIEYRTADGADLRDLLTGADLLMTRDPDVIAYAARLAEFTVTPLPWDRTYLLISAAAPLVITGRDSVDKTQFRDALARDVVTAASRAAVLPLTIPCRATGSLFPPPEVRRRVVYPRGDHTARELAERIVALGIDLTLDETEPEDLWHRLINNADVAYIVPFPRGEPTTCAGHPPMLSRTSSVEPLVDTRAHLILRRGAVRVSIDADGIPRILPPEAP